MSALLLVLTILRVVLRIYTYFLWARFVLEWIRVLRPSFKPKGFFLILSELIFTVTDPPIKFFRKIIPPIRLGTIQLDLGWMLTMLGCLILIGLIS
ncbi:MAG TPA: YggT family protein [Microbacteriaceae bacterium]|nr:YggT family protein [Microbacteriaceae bacterium]